MSFFIHAEGNSFLQAFIDETAVDNQWFVGLLTVLPDKDGAGGTEVNAAEYARQAVTLSVPNNSLINNTAAVTFPAPTTTGGYGEIVGLGFFLSSVVGTHPTPRAVATPAGGSFQMPVGFDRAFEIGYITLEFRE